MFNLAQTAGVSRVNQFFFHLQHPAGCYGNGGGWGEDQLLWAQQEVVALRKRSRRPIIKLWLKILPFLV